MELAPWGLARRSPLVPFLTYFPENFHVREFFNYLGGPGGGFGDLGAFWRGGGLGTWETCGRSREDRVGWRAGSFEGDLGVFWRGCGGGPGGDFGGDLEVFRRGPRWAARKKLWRRSGDVPEGVEVVTLVGALGEIWGAPCRGLHLGVCWGPGVLNNWSDRLPCCLVSQEAKSVLIVHCV